MFCRLVGTNPLFEPMLDIVTWTLRNKFQWHFNRNSYIFIKKCIWKCRPQNGGHLDKMAAEHYCDVIMSAMASQTTSLTIVYSTVYSGADQRKHQSSASLVFVRGIHRGPVNFPHKWPVTRKMFPFDDVIMIAVDKFKYNFVAVNGLISVTFVSWGVVDEKSSLVKIMDWGLFGAKPLSNPII